MSLLFNMLSRLVTTFLPRIKRLLDSWLQSPSAVILELPLPPPQSLSLFPLLPHLFVMKWWDQMSWSNQSILNEISPEYSLEGRLLKLKLQYFGHLIGRTNSFKKTLMLGKIEGWRGRGWQRMRWLDGIANLMDMNLSNRSWWWIGKPGMVQSLGSQRVGHNWTELTISKTWVKSLKVKVAQLCQTLRLHGLLYMPEYWGG